MVFRAGWRLSGRALQRLETCLNFMACAQWAKVRGFTAVPSFPDRTALMEHIARDVADQRVLYLEFGVFRGDLTRLWSRLLRHPQSRLHGFDSFEGLPEDWTPDQPRGQFSTQGRIPVIDDPRVAFFKGWFEEVLPGYRLPEHDRLLVMLDADLYSSTRYVLNRLRPHVVSGTYLYFDEFCHREHEMKAFSEFEKQTALRFEPVGESHCWEHVAFRVL
jgi:hypothetical protein